MSSATAVLAASTIKDEEELTAIRRLSISDNSPIMVDAQIPALAGLDILSAGAAEQKAAAQHITTAPIDFNDDPDEQIEKQLAPVAATAAAVRRRSLSSTNLVKRLSISRSSFILRKKPSISKLLRTTAEQKEPQQDHNNNNDTTDNTENTNDHPDERRRSRHLHSRNGSQSSTTSMSSAATSGSYAASVTSTASTTSSINRIRSSNGGTHIKNKQRDEHYYDFKELEQELSRFLSKNGVHKSNVLRLALLPFLREQRAADFTTEALEESSSYRIKVLQKWWLSILEALRDRSHPVAGSDRSAYLEAVSGIMARREWTHSNATTRYIFENLLYDTVKLVIAKLCQKSVPLSLAAFSGKVLAYAYFWAPGVAPVLLHLLQVPQQDMDRIIAVSFENRDLLAQSVKAIRVDGQFPVHLARLIGLTRGLGIAKKQSDGTIRMLRPKPPPQLPDLYGPWARRWGSFNSDVFAAFLKHYYSIISDMLPANPELPWYTHLAAPGLIMIHGFILGGLDAIVNRRKEPQLTKPDELRTVAVAPTPTSSSSAILKRRVDQLKYLGAVREILHNDDACVQNFEPYCRQFERILHAVALQTRVYDVEACLVLAGLVEEYLSSLVLNHSLSKHRVQIQKDNAVDWEFWIRVVQKMLSSDNSHTELRAMALLFNVWDNIPIGSNKDVESSNGGAEFDLGFDRPAAAGNGATLKDNGDLDYYLSNQQQEGLRWACTCWILSTDMWKRYFCHWQPLVRTYYQRLVCWRIASVGSESDLLSSILFSNYNSDARMLIKQRLVLSFDKITWLVDDANRRNIPPPSLEAAPPVVHRKLAIASNPASTVAPSTSPATLISSPMIGSSSVLSMSAIQSASPRRVNAFDVFDDIAYSYPTSMPPSELFPTEPPTPVIATARNSDETVRRREREQREVVIITNAPSVISKSPSTTSVLESIGSTIRKKWFKFTSSNESSTSNVNTIIKRSASSADIMQESTMYRIPSPEDGSVSSTPPSYSHTPVSGTSSTSTPPSPRSVKSLVLSSDGLSKPPAEVRRKSKHKAPPRTSLTMHLIPPPPQLLRARPEISRPQYKFALEFSERHAMRQRQLLSGERPAKSTESLSSPRLPFESREDDVLAFDSDEDEDDTEFFDCTQSSAKVKEDVDDVRHWKYAGRALREWGECVAEFEEFVQQRRMMFGASRLEDIAVPFMIAELPAKLKAG